MGLKNYDYFSIVLLYFELRGEGDYNIGRWEDELQLGNIDISGRGVAGIEIALMSDILDGVVYGLI